MLTLILSIFITFVQGITVYYTNRMRKFANGYSKMWGAAFAIFQVAMILATLRRIMFVAFQCGVDGRVKEILVWINDYPANLYFTVTWAVFVIVLYHWWIKFFGGMLHGAKWVEKLVDREHDIGSREAAVKVREIAVSLEEGEGIECAVEDKTAVMKIKEGK